MQTLSHAGLQSVPAGSTVQQVCASHRVSASIDICSAMYDDAAFWLLQKLNAAAYIICWKYRTCMAEGLCTYRFVTIQLHSSRQKVMEDGKHLFAHQAFVGEICGAFALVLVLFSTNLDPRYALGIACAVMYSLS